MFGARFGVAPRNPISQEYANPPEQVVPTPAQRERTEAFYLAQLPNNKQARKALDLQEVESAKRKVDKEFDTGFTEYLLGRMGDEQTRLPGDSAPYTRTPGWGERNRSLMGNEEVRRYVLDRQNARNEFDRYLNVLRQFRTALGYDPQTGAYWPPGVFEHYLYYKYILRAPDDDVFSSHEFLNDFQMWKTANTARAAEGIHKHAPGTTTPQSFIEGPTPMPTSVDKNNLVTPGAHIHTDYAHTHAPAPNVPPPGTTAGPSPQQAQPPTTQQQQQQQQQPYKQQPPQPKTPKGQQPATLNQPVLNSSAYTARLNTESKAVRQLIMRRTQGLKSPETDEIMGIINQRPKWTNAELSDLLHLLYNKQGRRIVPDATFGAIQKTLADPTKTTVVTNYLRLSPADQAELATYPGFDLSRVKPDDPTPAYIDFFYAFQGDQKVMKAVKDVYANQDDRAAQQFAQITSVISPHTGQPDTLAAKRIIPYLVFDPAETDDDQFDVNQIIINNTRQIITEDTPRGITFLTNVLDRVLGYDEQVLDDTDIDTAIFSVLERPDIPFADKIDILLAVPLVDPERVHAALLEQLLVVYDGAPADRKIDEVRLFAQGALSGIP